MPAAVEKCVSSLLAKWKSDPSSRPKPREKGQDAKSQAWAICQASQKRKAESDQQLTVLSDDGFGPTMIGAALTNRPHLKGLPPVTLEEKDGKPTLRVPLILLGKWRHPRGILDLTRPTIERFIQNFKGNVMGHDISLDNRHVPELGAMGWFSDVALEEHGGRPLMVGYADPTPKGKESVEERRYRYASIEFLLNYKHPLLETDRLSSDEIICEYKEDDMPEELEQVPGETLETENDERVRELEEQLEAARLEAQRGQQLVQRLEQEQRERVALEARLAAIEKERDRAQVEKILLEAKGFRDGEGRAHSKVLLDWAEAVLLGEKIVVQPAKDGQQEQAITLEADSGEEGMRAYVRQSVAYLLRRVPGVVPMRQAGVERDDSRALEADGEDITDKHVEEFWGRPVKKEE